MSESKIKTEVLLKTRKKKKGWFVVELIRRYLIQIDNDGKEHLIETVRNPPTYIGPYIDEATAEGILLSVEKVHRQDQGNFVKAAPKYSINRG